MTILQSRYEVVNNRQNVIKTEKDETCPLHEIERQFLLTVAESGDQDDSFFLEEDTILKRDELVCSFFKRKDLQVSFNKRE